MDWRYQTIVDCPAFSPAYPLQGIKRTAGSHPAKGMPEKKPDTWQSPSVNHEFDFFWNTTDLSAGRQGPFPTE
jgi:hypothetical protein